jgi:hypothetical protein
VLKWIGGILAAVIGGSLLWMLTNKVFPDWFPAPPPPPQPNILGVECAANPWNVSPGGTSEITVKVLRNGEPLERAPVQISSGGGTFATGNPNIQGETYSGGVYHATWTAPDGSMTYRMSVTASSSRHSKEHRSARTTCQVTVGPER